MEPPTETRAEPSTTSTSEQDLSSADNKSNEATAERQFTRSRVYAPDGLIFKAGSKLFRFPTIWHLAQSSEFFEGVQELGANVPTGGEGSSDENPIIMHDREDDFESFALWLFQMKYPLVRSEWIGVLAISTKYCINSGIDQAIDQLNDPTKRPRFQPCYKLRLAWEFGIEQWYGDCLEEILTLPPRPLSREDIRDLEPQLVVIIMSLREKVQRYRTSLLTFIPEIRLVHFCDSRSKCTKEFLDTYLTVVMEFAHTKSYKLGRDVYKHLKSFDIPDMHVECKKVVMAQLQESGLLWKEEDIVRQSCEGMKEVLRSTQPQLPRPEPRYTES